MKLERGYEGLSKMFIHMRRDMLRRGVYRYIE
jgi:hypothetical protein